MEIMNEFFWISGTIVRLTASVIFLVSLFQYGSEIFSNSTNTLLLVIVMLIMGTHLREKNL